MPVQDQHPKATELFYASIIATALVYAAGMLIISALVLATSRFEEWPRFVETFLMAGTVGTLMATFAGLVLIAPMGTGCALAILRLTRPAWWQGPLTGLLVAMSLEAGVLAIVGQAVIRPTAANAITMSLPVVLAIFAGGYVQRRILHWPEIHSPQERNRDGLTTSSD